MSPSLFSALMFKCLRQIQQKPKLFLAVLSLSERLLACPFCSMRLLQECPTAFLSQGGFHRALPNTSETQPGPTPCFFTVTLLHLDLNIVSCNPSHPAGLCSWCPLLALLPLAKLQELWTPSDCIYSVALKARPHIPFSGPAPRVSQLELSPSRLTHQAPNC